MIDVLIKGMEMPKNCAECRFCVNGFTDDAPMYECACEYSENVSVLVDDHGKPFNFRPEWCPLIEVPPHGDLIDKEEALKRVRAREHGICTDGVDVGFNLGIDCAFNLLKTQNTIIEAEGSE